MSIHLKCGEHGNESNWKCLWETFYILTLIVTAAVTGTNKMFWNLLKLAKTNLQSKHIYRDLLVVNFIHTSFLSPSVSESQSDDCKYESVMMWSALYQTKRDEGKQSIPKKLSLLSNLLKFIQSIVEQWNLQIWDWVHLTVGEFLEFYLHFTSKQIHSISFSDMQWINRRENYFKLLRILLMMNNFAIQWYWSTMKNYSLLCVLIVVICWSQH